MGTTLDEKITDGVKLKTGGSFLERVNIVNLMYEMSRN